MGLFDKLKDFVNNTDEDYLEEPEDRMDRPYDPQNAEYEEEEPDFTPKPRQERTVPPPKVVDIHSSTRPHVVFKKLDRFEEVASVADVLNEKRIVILNLETCPNDVSRRIIDFLYGVAYANDGEIKRVAGRAYIITPYNVPVTGEMLEEMDSSIFPNKLFE